MNTILIILIGIFFASIGQIFLKFGISDTGQISTFTLSSLLGLIFNIPVLIGLLCYGIGTIFWLIALSREELSFVYPFISLTFIIILFASFFLFSEKIGAMRILGTIVIIFGLLIIIRG